MTFKASTKKLSEIAREVNVRYVLEGSVRKAGNNLRVTAQLIDATHDTHVWTEKYSGTMDDIFDIQEKVSQAIVSELAIKITGKEKRKLSERVISNSTAYDYYIRARRELTQWNVGAFDRALKYLQMALSIEGPNALLLGAMAYTYWNYANIGIDVNENTSKTENLVNQTFELDPESADAHLAMGLTNLAFKGRPLAAVKNFRQVIATRPNDFDALMWLAASYEMQGKPDKAIPYWKKMKLVDPLSSLVVCWPGIIDFYQGNFSKALQPVLAAHEMEPSNFFYVLLPVNILGCCSKYAEAYDFLKKNMSLDVTDYLNQAFKIFLHALKQEKEKVLELMTPELKTWGQRDPQWGHFMAQILTFAGMKEESLEWLESSVNMGFCNYPLLSDRDPINQYMKGDLRFEKLLERMKAAWEQFDLT